MARRRARNVWVELEGSAELEQALERVSRSVRSERALEALMAAAATLRDAARRRAPVRTGRLRDSIFASRGRPERDVRGLSVLAGVSPRAPHRALVEYGTVHMAARPYWRPTLAMDWPAAQRRLMEQLSQAILEAAR